MQSLLQVFQEEEGEGKSSPLPGFLPILSQRGIVPEKGQMLMLAAQPNGGKSMLALWYVISKEIPTMFFSADTDKRTTFWRSCAIRTGIEFDQLKAMSGTSAAAILEDEALEILRSGIQFEFNPSPSLRDIDLELQAYEEVYGPGHMQCVVIDNLLNVANDAGDFNGLVTILGELHAMCRNKDVALIILHHVNDGSNPEYPAARGSIRGKVSQYPEMIVTLALLGQQQQMRIAMVKHRHKTPSPSGEDYETVFVDPTRMTFYNTRTDLQNAQTRREWE